MGTNRLGSKTTADSDSSHEIKIHLLLGKKAMTNLDSVLKSRDITLLTKVQQSFDRFWHMVKTMVFPVVTNRYWELDHNEGWVPKNWLFRAMVLKKTLVNPLDSKEIKPVNPKGNQSWIFIGSTDAEVPILWPPDAKSRLIGKDFHAEKDWRQEKRATEAEMVGRHQLNGQEFEQTLGDSEGHGSLACCSPWCHRVGHKWGTELESYYLKFTKWQKQRILVQAFIITIIKKNSVLKMVVAKERDLGQGWDG